jgi:hypothetical protein
MTRHPDALFHRRPARVYILRKREPSPSRLGNYVPSSCRQPYGNSLVHQGQPQKSFNAPEPSDPIEARVRPREQRPVSPVVSMIYCRCSVYAGWNLRGDSVVLLRVGPR